MKIRNANFIPALNHPPLSHSFISLEFPLSIRLPHTYHRSIILTSIDLTLLSWKTFILPLFLYPHLPVFTFFFLRLKMLSVIIIIQHSAYGIWNRLLWIVNVVYVYICFFFLTSMPLCNPLLNLPTTYLLPTCMCIENCVYVNCMHSAFRIEPLTSAFNLPYNQAIYLVVLYFHFLALVHDPKCENAAIQSMPNSSMCTPLGGGKLLPNDYFFFNSLKFR